MRYQAISLFASKGAIYYVTIATVIFSRVKSRVTYFIDVYTIKSIYAFAIDQPETAYVAEKINNTNIIMNNNVLSSRTALLLLCFLIVGIHASGHPCII